MRLKVATFLFFCFATAGIALAARESGLVGSPPSVRSLIRGNRPALVSAFLMQDDPESLRSFERNADRIDAVFPDWYFVNEAACGVRSKINESARQILRESGATVIPRVANEGNGGWRISELQEVLRDPYLRACVADRLSELALLDGVAGINLDFEGFGIDYREEYRDFIKRLGRKLHRQGQLLVIDVPFGDPAFDLRRAAATADAVMVMAYDENYALDRPGPVSGLDWFRDNLARITGQVPKEKIIVGIGAYGYDWREGSVDPAKSLGFGEAIGRAFEAKAEPTLDPQSRNMFFAYDDRAGERHYVWFLNGATAWNQWQHILQEEYLGAGVWRLGLEDPSLWSFLGIDSAPSGLATVAELDGIFNSERDEVFRLISSPHPGGARFTFDEEGFINQYEYTALPSGYVIGSSGRPFAEKDLVLTFDDGPDPSWTPRILDVLDRHRVPAAFFMVGEQVMENPELVRRALRRGDLVGNHTFFHSDPAKISPGELRSEVASTTAAILEAGGRGIKLFRAPYDVEPELQTSGQLRTIRTVSEMGYITVGAKIDSQDWKRDGAQEMAKRIEAGLSSNQGHIILMHDGGGDRSQTVELLELLIPRLEEKGYRFVSLSESMGLSWGVLNPVE